MACAFIPEQKWERMYKMYERLTSNTTYSMERRLYVQMILQSKKGMSHPHLLYANEAFSVSEMPTVSHLGH